MSPTNTHQLRLRAPRAFSRKLTLAAAGLLAAACAPDATGTDEQERADSRGAELGGYGGSPVTEWVDHSLDTVRVEETPTPEAARLYAMVTAAMFDGVNGIDRAWGIGYESAVVEPAGAPAFASRSAAAVGAAHTVLSEFADAHQSALDEARARDLEALGGVADPFVENGLIWGEEVGQAVVAERADDGSQEPDIIPGGDEPGEHRADFNRAYADMDPFVIDDKAPYLQGPPPALTSLEYAEAVEDVYIYGKDDGDPEREALAAHYHTPAGTIRPTGVWIQAGLQLAEQQGTTHSLSRTARLMAQLGMAIADTVLPIWEDKGEYHFWRPYDAITEADTDGNPHTHPDPDWETRYGNKGGSGEYTSGFSAFSAASAVVFDNFYCSDRISFCFETDNAKEILCYDDVYEAAFDAGRSRIYQGVHFEFTNQISREVGLGVGDEVVQNALQPIDWGQPWSCDGQF